MIVNTVRPSDSQTKAIYSQMLCTMKPPELPCPQVSLKLDRRLGLWGLHEQSEPLKLRITASPPGCFEMNYEQS